MITLHPNFVCQKKNTKYKKIAKHIANVECDSTETSKEFHFAFKTL